MAQDELHAASESESPSYPRIRVAGDAAVLIELGDRIDQVVNRRVHAIAAELRRILPSAGLLEVTPGYATVLVSYDPCLLPYNTVAEYARQAVAVGPSPVWSGRLFVLPVAYGGEFGPDLDAVGAYNGLTPAAVIGRHSDRDYPIFCLGFSPGFPLLGGLDESLHTPRLDTPRPRVPEGSVAIGGEQTGVYPSATPGGWRLIGRTPLKLFDVQKTPPVVYQPGDSIRFHAIDAAEYTRLSEERRMPVGVDVQSSVEP